MTPEAFETLLTYLVSTCRVLSFDELRSAGQSEAPRVVLSFDDGYRDFVDYVAPILARHRVRANLNVIARSVETGETPWIVRVVDALNAATPPRVRALKVPGFTDRLESDDDLSKTRYGTTLTAYLKNLSPADREAVSAEIEALLAETDPECFTSMMSRSDVISVARVHDIGAHSYDHENLSRVTDAEFSTDLDRCGAFFARLGRPMKIFAFPYGSFRNGQIAIVRMRGVEHVLLAGECPARTDDGVYTRITMYGDSAAELQLRAMGLPLDRHHIRRSAT